jgi:hypothetical protein
MKFEIDESYMRDITIRKEWGVYDHIKHEDLTPDQLFRIIKGEDRCTSVGSEDHPEFAKLREQLGSDGFIRIQRSSWNGDMVTKPFTLNGKNFKKNTRFPCGAAMKSHIQYMK